MNTKHCTTCNTRMEKWEGMWRCPHCHWVAPLRGTPPVKPNVSLRLDPVLLAWLRGNGGIQPNVRKWATAAKDGRLRIVEEEENG